ncbi:hypothetical protein M0G43_07975 [Subsaxibacter sp. CAU 1640]|uniref:DUF6705 family protein n=1 Tax=Subsaxibacter sp. CAU 1640 TaxID=2933271 RepID=UPI0020069156|nr:hypothetical protein [Subsaxibacter sp. CAU 1640]
MDSLGMHKTPNAYYKDINNDLNGFEGTWLYTSGNTSLKIVLVKSVMFYNGDYYEDLMVGGYQYVENGVEKINTLSDANNLNIGYSGSIWGNSIHNNCFYIPVDDCVLGEKRLILAIFDPVTNNHSGNIILHKRTVSGQQALKAMIDIGYIGENYEGVPTPLPTMPSQMHNILFIKQ